MFTSNSSQSAPWQKYTVERVELHEQKVIINTLDARFCIRTSVNHVCPWEQENKINSVDTEDPQMSEWNLREEEEKKKKVIEISTLLYVCL